MHITINNYDGHILLNHVDQSNLIDHVPAMVYRATISPHGIVLIKDRKIFDLPSIRYGKHKKYFQQITSSYDRNSSSTGVMLMGEKGSGKSLLAEEIGNWMIRQDIPVISIGYPIAAEELMIIIRAVGPCMVYFDEFGKIYSEGDNTNCRKEMLLPLFSDTSLTGVIFVITGNDQREFSSYLVSRPQRFRFLIRYGHGVGSDVVDDVLETMKVPEMFHEYLHYYTKGYCPNLDSFLCVVRETAGCKNIEELVERCEILNVGTLPEVKWRVSNVVNLSEKSAEEIYWDINFDQNKKMLHLIEGTSRNFKQSSSSQRTKIHVTLPETEEPFSVTIAGKQSFEVELTYGFEVSQVITCHYPNPTVEEDSDDNSVPPRWPALGRITDSENSNMHFSRNRDGFFEPQRKSRW